MLELGMGGISISENGTKSETRMQQPPPFESVRSDLIIL